MKYKYVILGVVYVLLFSLDCHFSNYPILNMIHTEYLTETDVLMSLHDSVNGYNGFLELLVVYTLPFLFGCYYISDKEVPCNVIRYTSREKYKKVEIKKVLFVAVIFTFFHQLIDYIYIVKKFSWSLLTEYSFVKYIIIAGCIAALFYVQTGILYHVINDWQKNDLVALIMILCINFAQYVVIKYSIVSWWIPGKDLFVAFEVLSQNLNYAEVLFVVARNILTTICLYLASKIVFEKKDVMRHEK